ncbi:MAG: lysoplasmalogenase [Clostridia bacterium]|nr:lysoplasmalogenase [Clostridia bacterium]
MYIVLMCIFSVICLAVMPFFLVEQRHPSVKSLLLKMVCASMFLCVGIFALLQAGRSLYALFMVLGLVCSWFGDLFLHIQGKAKMPCAVIGVLSFLSAHVMYLIAFSNVITMEMHSSLLTVGTLIFVLAMLAIYTVIVILTKTPLKLPLILLYIYAVFLTIMCFSALRLSVFLFPTTPIGAILLGTGAILFVLSDGSLGILMFNKKLKSNFPLKIFNIGTYFVGQLMLAATILFIR